MRKPTHAQLKEHAASGSVDLRNSILLYNRRKQCSRFQLQALDWFKAATSPFWLQLDVQKNGLSRNTGEGLTDLKEEVVVIAKSVGRALNDFDLVVDAFEQTGV